MTAMVEDGGPAWLSLVFSCVGDFFSAVVAAQERRAAFRGAAHLSRLSDDELLAFGQSEDHIDRLRRRSRAERPPKPLMRYSVIGKAKPQREAAAYSATGHPHCRDTISTIRAGVIPPRHSSCW